MLAISAIHRKQTELVTEDLGLGFLVCPIIAVSVCVGMIFAAYWTLRATAWFTLWQGHKEGALSIESLFSYCPKVGELHYYPRTITRQKGFLACALTVW